MVGLLPSIGGLLPSRSLASAFVREIHAPRVYLSILDVCIALIVMHFVLKEAPGLCPRPSNPLGVGDLMDEY